MIRSFVFDQGKMVGCDLDLDALRLVRGDPGLHVWLDLDDPTPEEARHVLEDIFNFHPLAIEDCVAVSDLPKIEDYDSYLFMVIHAVDFSQRTFETTELNVFLSKDFLVTYHTAPLRSVAFLIDKVRQNPTNTAKGPDRLAHSILDNLIDLYKPVLDQLGQEVDDLEDAMFDAREEVLMRMLISIRKQITQLRSIIRPQAEVLSRLSRGEFKLIRAHLLPYFRDITDQLARLDANALSLSDQVLLIMDVYLNKAQNETNKIIKLLTILTAVTTPLMVVGTWYGMNFERMPELSSPHGYWYAMGITLFSTAAFMSWLVWKKFI